MTRATYTQNPKADDIAAQKLMANARSMPCAYCGREMKYGTTNQPTRDHVWPRRMRSVDAGRTGKVWCCHKCNQKKADMSPSEWLSFLEAQT